MLEYIPVGSSPIQMVNDIMLDGKLAGVIITQTDKPEYLSEIYIDKDYRRQGIASKAINHFNIKTLICVTWNTEAIACYTKLGFKPKNSNGYTIQFERE